MLKSDQRRDLQNCSVAKNSQIALMCQNNTEFREKSGVILTIPELFDRY